MDVADRIVVMNPGYIEQVGGPRELYEHPSNAFVMGLSGRSPGWATTSSAPTTWSSDWSGTAPPWRR
jgi:ABC-type sugar transport system ATPase subunit